MREGERGEGRPADAVPHCTSGGGESGWVQCLYSCTVFNVVSLTLWFFFFLTF